MFKFSTKLVSFISAVQSTPSSFPRCPVGNGKAFCCQISPSNSSHPTPTPPRALSQPAFPPGPGLGCCRHSAAGSLLALPQRLHSQPAGTMLSALSFVSLRKEVETSRAFQTSSNHGKTVSCHWPVPLPECYRAVIPAPCSKV